MDRKERVTNQLYKIVELFQGENIPKAIKQVTFPPFNVPSNNWSLCNRLMMWFSGTMDARGFNQWKETERKVKKGAKAIYILAPTTYRKASCPCGYRFSPKMQEQDLSCPKCKTPLDGSRIKMIVGGFKGVPVFRKEDTQGKELEYEQIELPKLPLFDVAQEWDLTVKGIPLEGNYLGYYQSEKKKIALATPEEQVFFHELAHASQDRLGLLKRDKQFKEVTAELSSLVLAELVGRENPNTGATYQYIRHYVGTDDKEQIGIYLIKVLSDVEKIINNIIEAASKVRFREQSTEMPVLATN